MELAVGILHPVAAQIFAVDLAHQLVELIEFRIADLGRRQGRRLSLDHQARLDEFEGGDVEARRVRLAGDPPHIGARSNPHLDEALDFERDDRLADGGAADIVLDRQVALGRQAFADGIVSRGQFVEKLASQLLVEAILRVSGGPLARTRSFRAGFHTTPPLGIKLAIPILKNLTGQRSPVNPAIGQ